MVSAENLLEIFRREYFGKIDQYLAWHDGYEANFACLDVLAPAEQAQAAAELLAGLRAQTADARAMLGLGHLRWEEALPLLHDYLRRGAYSMYALGAIAAINPAGLYRPLVAGLLSLKAEWTRLIDLEMGLYQYFTLPQLGPAIAVRLFALLTHADFLVRSHALDAIRQLYGLQSADAQRCQSTVAIRADKLFNLITSDKSPANYRQAQQLLLSKLDAGLLREYPLK